MLQIRFPDHFENEQRYIFDIIFTEFLGIPFEAEIADITGVQIRMNGDFKNKEIIFQNTFFCEGPEALISRVRLPQGRPEHWDIESKQLPVLFGSRLPNGQYISGIAERYEIGVDIFGICFFLLTCFEETVNASRDSYQRFRYEYSVLAKWDFIERPIVDEYVEMLWNLLSKMWPSLTRKTQNFKLYLSHDVDAPWVGARRTIKGAMLGSGADVLVRKDPKLAFKRAFSWLSNNLDLDPANTFNWIMDESEKYNIKSAFYFICDHTHPSFDGNYFLDEPWIRKTLKRIFDRSHEIGLHPSFNTFQNEAQTRLEFLKLRQNCDDLGIRQDYWGGRQHCLRWENPTTWQNWENVGLSYDSTLTYVDRVGFRCGTCHEFSVYNLSTRKKMNLRERPLIVMEGTVFEYMKLTQPQYIEQLNRLVKTCKEYQGQFTLLWHNHSLISSDQKKLYQTTLASILST